MNPALTNAPTILIVEDDPDIRELVQYNLEREGFRVVVACDGREGYALAKRKIPALILLDLMLPGMSGLDVCKQIRAQAATSHIPVIMLTAKGEEGDIVLGLEMGADDYIPKPFRIKELVARVRAALRRGQRAGEESRELVHAGDIEMNLAKHEVRVGGHEVRMTLSEFRLLAALIAAPGRVFTRDQLLDRMTGGEAIIIDRNVDVHIRAIRKKMGQLGTCIEAIRGVGYKFRDANA